MARDKFHFEFRTALENEGWEITDDPLTVKAGRFPIYVDLGAERLIAAEKGEDKIAVEIKTFGNYSFITAFYEAVGKFIVYRKALEMREPDRTLFLAIPEVIFRDFQDDSLVQRVFRDEKIHLIIYNPRTKLIVQWIK